jgi:hypothetical protein
LNLFEYIWIYLNLFEFIWVWGRSKYREMELISRLLSDFAVIIRTKRDDYENFSYFPRWIILIYEKQ